MKKGISLIVLVITIIVIIILAGAVILSLSANNPIEQAGKAKTASNQAEVQSAVTLYLAKLMAEGEGAATISGGPAFATVIIAIPGKANVVGITAANLGMAALPTGTWTLNSAGVVDDGIL